jgi:GNAT superfamily N-acetyltransferase
MQFPREDTSDTRPEDEPRVRRADIGDAIEIARLLTVLEHPTTGAEVRDRWDAFTSDGNCALVAERGDGTLCGVVTMHSMYVLHRPRAVGRVTALVIDSDVRGHGIGRALVVATEEVLRHEGCGLLEITSNARRTEAHAFYQRLGYTLSSVRLFKDLDA